MLAELALPPVRFRPLMAATRLRFCDVPIAKMRFEPLPLIERLPGPGPTIDMGREIDRAPPVSVMVCEPDGRLNWIVSFDPSEPLTCACSADVSDRPSVPSTTMIASRSVSADPALVLSARLLTMRTAGAWRSSSDSNCGRNEGRRRMVLDWGRRWRKAGKNELRNSGFLLLASLDVGIGRAPTSKPCAGARATRSSGAAGAVPFPKVNSGVAAA